MSMNVEGDIDRSDNETASWEKPASGKCAPTPETETSAPSNRRSSLTVDCSSAEESVSTATAGKSDNKNNGQQVIFQGENETKLNNKSPASENLKQNGDKLNELNALDQTSESTDESTTIDQQQQSPKKAKGCSKEQEGRVRREGSEQEETQEYELNSVTETAKLYVDYKEEDFGTDSDFDQSDTDYLDEARQESGNHTSIVNVMSRKRKHKEVSEKNMGAKWFKLKGSKNKGASDSSVGAAASSSREDKCQGTSSEEDTERPWRQAQSTGTQSSRSAKKGKARQSPYPLRSPGLGPLKRQSQWSDQDTQKYRDGYPGKKDILNQNQNLRFYRGEIKSKPDGACIDDFHKDWWFNLDRLESHHGYIQWLFPIRESGMNFQAQELQLHEAQAIQKDDQAMERFTKSYEMMLHFYGIKLINRATGEVARADNWKPRFQHLNHSMHNYLRITRILKSLGEMGLEHYKYPFLVFMLEEAIRTRKLDRTLDSWHNYWIGTLKEDTDRAQILKCAKDLSRTHGQKY